MGFRSWLANKIHSGPPRRRPIKTVIGRGLFQSSDTGRLFEDWTSSPTDIDTALVSELPKMQARCREQIVNNPNASRFINLIKNNVVGPDGVGLQSQVMRGRKIDGLIAPTIEAGFKDWGERWADMSGRQDWRGILLQAIGSAGYDGEFFIRKVRNPEHGPYGFGLQPIAADRIDAGYKDVLSDGNRVYLGIEYDQFDRPAAYYVKQRLRENAVSTINAAYDRKRIPASDMIHGYLPLFIGQTRGIPWLAPALWDLKQVLGWKQAAVINARAGAAKMAFIESDGLANPYQGEEHDTLGNTEMVAEPGTIAQLQPGASVNVWDPTYPHGEFADFLKACLRGVAAGLNVAYDALAADLEGISYSSIRAGVLEDREAWKGLQAWLIHSLCRPVFEEWLLISLGNGALVAPKLGTLHAPRFDEFKKVRWQPRRWAWVDPAKDMSANESAVDLRVKTRSQIIREQGGDPEEVFRELDAEESRLGPAIAQQEDSRAMRASRVNMRAVHFGKYSIKTGRFDDSSPWQLTPEDAEELRKNPRRHFLLEDPGLPNATRYTLPTGKFRGGEYLVYLSALEQAKDLAPLLGEDGQATDDAQNAADLLIGLIESKELGSLEIGDYGEDVAKAPDAEEDEPKPPEDEGKPQMPDIPPP